MSDKAKKDQNKQQQVASAVDKPKGGDDDLKPVKINWYEMERSLRFTDRYAIDPDYDGDLSDTEHNQDLNVKNIISDRNGNLVNHK